MSEREQRELDAWIAKHLMGRDDVEWNGQISWDSDKPIPAHYTADPAAAMQVLEKCAQMLHGEDREETVSIGYDTPRYVVEKTNCNQNLRMEAASLPLAICLFAKDLFSK